MNSVSGFLNTCLFSLKKSRIFPFVLQVTLFLCLGFLLVVLAAPSGIKSLNTGMLVLWHIWWPLIPFILLLTGRLWCSICPFSSTAIVLNRLFPFQLLKNTFLLKNRVLFGLCAFVIIITLDNVFSIASNQLYTLYFFLSLIALLVGMAIVFDHKTYCNVICPFNLFAHLYKHVSFLRIVKSNNPCGSCNRHNWVPLTLLGQDIQKAGNDKKQMEQSSPLTNRDWRNSLECLKKCKTNGTRIHVVNPFSSGFHDEQPSMVEAFAPSLIIGLFAISVFSKSNYSTNIFFTLQASYGIDLNAFLFLSTMVALLAVLLFNILVLGITVNLLKIDKKVVIKSLYCLIPMLLLFHLSIALKDARGVVSLQYVYSCLSFLDTYIPKKNVLQLVSYGLSVTGILLSVFILFRFIWDSYLSKVKATSLFIVLLGSVFIINSILALTTNNYLQYFG